MAGTVHADVSVPLPKPAWPRMDLEMWTTLSQQEKLFFIRSVIQVWEEMDTEVLLEEKRVGRKAAALELGPTAQDMVLSMRCIKRMGYQPPDVLDRLERYIPEHRFAPTAPIHSLLASSIKRDCAGIPLLYFEE